MTYKKFKEDEIVMGKMKQVSSGFFNGKDSVLQCNFYTSSQANTMTGSNQWDVKNGQYYINAYYKNELYFSVAYGSPTNSGSSRYNTNVLGVDQSVYTNESKVVYSTYRNLLLPPGQDTFLFADKNGSNTYSIKPARNIIVFSFNADKMKDRIDPGQWQLSFQKEPGATSTPSYAMRTLIDDSCIVKEERDFYNIIEGSIENGIPTPKLYNGKPLYTGLEDEFAAVGGYGMFYPKYGVIVFNEASLGANVGLLSLPETSARNPYGPDFNTKYNGYTNEGSIEFKDKWRGYLQRVIWWSFINAGLEGKQMYVRKSEFVPCKNFYVRVKSKEFNYSTNPTYLESDGHIKNKTFVDNPTTYITTVGLYDDDNNLVAVGKLSKPVKKTMSNEILIKVRVDF